MALIVLLLRAKAPVGLSVLAGGLLIWLIRSADIPLLLEAVCRTATAFKTWDLLGALFAVMVIEAELQKSDAVNGMVRALQGAFRSTHFTLIAMPAFIGLLPSAGGARFSAPIVESASQGLGLSPESKAAINFWFRHVFENVRPIAPGLILACALARVPLGETILHQLWIPVLFTAAGWLVMLRPIKAAASKSSEEPLSRDLCLQAGLAILPIVASFALMLFTRLSASLAIGLVAAAMIPILRLCRRPAPLAEILREALDAKLFLSVIAILCFTELVSSTGVLRELAQAILSAPLPAPLLLGATGFVLGLILGMTPGYVSIAMPLVAALYPEGSLEVTGVVLTGGLAGIMLTPTHLCLTVTLDYFKADLLKTLWPCFQAAALLLLAYAPIAWLFWK